MDVVAAWEAVDNTWRECFELAWEAYAAGAIPVGALVVDAGGAIVSRGRNRIAEREAPARQLAGSWLAHAEVNALAQLAPDRKYRDHTLYSTLEPCILCLGAARLATVGRIRYAAADPDGGAATGTVDNAMSRRWWPELDGPRDDALARLAALLGAEFFVSRNPDSVVTANLTAEERGAAEELARRGAWERARSGESLRDVLPSIGDLLARAPVQASEQAPPTSSG